MNTRVLLRMLTPSSNPTPEPVTSPMLAGLPHVSTHFGRFKVTETALSERADRATKWLHSIGSPMPAFDGGFNRTWRLFVDSEEPGRRFAQDICFLNVR